MKAPIKGLTCHAPIAELPHSLTNTINASTRSIYPDTSRPEDRGADAAKDSHHWVMASGGEAHTMGTRGEVATNGRDGGIRYTRGTASTERLLTYIRPYILWVVHTCSAYHREIL